MKPSEQQIIKNFQSIMGENIPNLSFEILSPLIKEAKIMSFKKGETIVNQGKICQNLYFIHEGMLRYYFLKDEKEITSWFGFPNDFATVFASFWLQSQSRESIQALTNCVLIAIPFKVLNHLFQNHLEWERVGRVFITQYALRLEDRIHLLHQAMTADEKYKYLIENHPKIIQFIPNKHVASYLGITRETLSRIRSSIN